MRQMSQRVPFLILIAYGLPALPAAAFGLPLLLYLPTFYAVDLELGFTLVGAVILAASVAGTRFRRVREVVILKTLGATRAAAGRIFSVEFLTLGVVAGLMGALLATVFSRLLLLRLLDAKFDFDPLATAVAVVATAALAQASGWLAGFKILRQKPLEVLRDE